MEVVSHTYMQCQIYFGKRRHVQLRLSGLSPAASAPRTALCCLRAASRIDAGFQQHLLFDILYKPWETLSNSLLIPSLRYFNSLTSIRLLSTNTHTPHTVPPALHAGRFTVSSSSAAPTSSFPSQGPSFPFLLQQLLR